MYIQFFFPSKSTFSVRIFCPSNSLPHFIHMVLHFFDSNVFCVGFSNKITPHV
uniref:Uncharacterized protein n=1 Tax=Octopus bimaculoides TaxID=37653 RepID=A0A0L8FY22_OCTBM